METTIGSDSYKQAGLNYSLSPQEQCSHSDPDTQETGPETTNRDKGHLLICYNRIIIGTGFLIQQPKGPGGTILILLDISAQWVWKDGQRPQRGCKDSLQHTSDKKPQQNN